ncbi:hypothetical protein P692DRAFT_20879792 [Suillus brevipes Sb2]|nr:hypothetical protein P692DRAFT_20879792 [Suillus brevipes Sb2]
MAQPVLLTLSMGCYPDGSNTPVLPRDKSSAFGSELTSYRSIFSAVVQTLWLLFTFVYLLTSHCLKFCPPTLPNTSAMVTEYVLTVPFAYTMASPAIPFKLSGPLTSDSRLQENDTRGTRLADVAESLTQAAAGGSRTLNQSNPGDLQNDAPPTPPHSSPTPRCTGSSPASVQREPSPLRESTITKAVSPAKDPKFFAGVTRAMGRMIHPYTSLHKSQVAETACSHVKEADSMQK